MRLIFSIYNDPTGQVLWEEESDIVPRKGDNIIYPLSDPSPLYMKVRGVLWSISSREVWLGVERVEED